MSDVFTGGTAAGAEDYAAIMHVMALYCRGIDRKDPHMIASAYWPDAIDHHGVFDGNAHEFAGWIVPFLREKYTSTQHILGQCLINVSGDEAIAETYFNAYHGKLAEGRRRLEQVTGRYADRLQRRDGEWRIFERFMAFDFVTERDHDRSPVEDAGLFIFGAEAAEDVSRSVGRLATHKAEAVG